jgi:hypothetical protein
MAKKNFVFLIVGLFILILGGIVFLVFKPQGKADIIGPDGYSQKVWDSQTEWQEWKDTKIAKLENTSVDLVPGSMVMTKVPISRYLRPKQGGVDSACWRGNFINQYSGETDYCGATDEIITNNLADNVTVSRSEPPVDEKTYVSNSRCTSSICVANSKAYFSLHSENLPIDKKITQVAVRFHGAYDNPDIFAQPITENSHLINLILAKTETGDINKTPILNSAAFNFRNLERIYNKNPWTGATWQASDIPNLMIGWELVNTSFKMKVFAMELKVSYEGEEYPEKTYATIAFPGVEYTGQMYKWFSADKQAKIEADQSVELKFGRASVPQLCNAVDYQEWKNTPAEIGESTNLCVRAILGTSDPTKTPELEKISINYLPPNAAVINKVTPACDKTNGNAVLTIEGAGFGETQGDKKLYFVNEGTPVEFGPETLVWSDTKITATIAKELAVLIGDKTISLKLVSGDNTTLSKEITLNCSHTISANTGEGGDITPAGDIAVSDGANKSFLIKASDGYMIDSVLVDGENKGALTSYEFINVTANHAILAKFKQVKFKVTAVIASSSDAIAFKETGGEITSPEIFPIEIDDNGSATIQFASSKYWELESITDNTEEKTFNPTDKSYTVNNIHEDHNIEIAFRRNPFLVQTKIIPDEKGNSNGVIAPTGLVELQSESNATFKVTASEGYLINQIKVYPQDITKNFGLGCNSLAASLDNSGKKEVNVDLVSIKNDCVVEASFKPREFEISANFTDNGFWSKLINKIISFLKGFMRSSLINEFDRLIGISNLKKEANNFIDKYAAAYPQDNSIWQKCKTGQLDCTTILMELTFDTVTNEYAQKIKNDSLDSVFGSIDPAKTWVQSGGQGTFQIKTNWDNGYYINKITINNGGSMSCTYTKTGNRNTGANCVVNNISNDYKIKVEVKMVLNLSKIVNLIKTAISGGINAFIQDRFKSLDWLEKIWFDGIAKLTKNPPAKTMKFWSKY